MSGAGLLVVDLLSSLTALVRPWEVGDWDDEEGVGTVGNTGEGIVPGDESGEDAKDTAGLDAGGVWCAGAVLKVADSEHEEGQVQGEKEGEKGHCGAESADEEEEGEDEPSLEFELAWTDKELR